MVKKKFSYDKKYSAGFQNNIESEGLGAGLNPNVIRKISKMKKEPDAVLKMRIKAFETLSKMDVPKWADFDVPEIDFQKISYYSAPKNLKKNIKSIDDIDPKIKAVYDRLGIPLSEQKLMQGVADNPADADEKSDAMAIDAVLDSVSVATTYKDQLAAMGIIFCSMSEAVKNHYEIVKKYLCKAVPIADSFYSALNTAVFSDGTFVYVPKGVKCPIDLGSYFRINAKNAGQFERTLIIADEGAEVNYLEGCSAPQHDENQLHVGVVELVANAGAAINYSTVQNWYAGDEHGVGGIYNFVTKRGIAYENAKISWTQLEVGSAKTWKYPSCILMGDGSVGEFFSVALTTNYQAADTGTKMVHVGRNTSSTVISKSIALKNSRNIFRCLVDAKPTSENVKNFTRCDNLIVGSDAVANAYPVLSDAGKKSTIEQEATVSNISAEQMFFLNSRGIETDRAMSLIVNGFAGDIVKKLPAEFMMEAKELINIKLEE